jgi:hypothetical protein
MSRFEMESLILLAATLGSDAAWARCAVSTVALKKNFRSVSNLLGVTSGVRSAHPRLTAGGWIAGWREVGAG